MDAKDELCKVDGGGGKAQSGMFIKITHFWTTVGPL